LYGFLFAEGDNGKMKVKMNGRFRQNGHGYEQGVSVRALMGVYRTDTRARLPVNRPKQDEQSFLSLGSDGRLLSWRCGEEGWRPQPDEETKIRTAQNSQTSHCRRLIGGCVSQFACNIVLLAEEETQRIICFNRATGNVESMVSYA
jgi:hypothetical protein